MVNAKVIADCGLRRCPEMDWARALAVYLMILCHTLRIVSFSERPEWTCRLLEVEPFAQILFLFLLGAAAWCSRCRRSDSRGWAFTQLRRSIALLLLGALLVVLERGRLQSFDLLFSGFLPLAGKVILLLTLAGLPNEIKMRMLLGAFGFLGLIVGTYLCEWAGFWWNGFNSGSGPLLPLACAAALGWCWASCRSSWSWIFVGVFLVVGGGLLAGRGDFALWLGELGRYTALVRFWTGQGWVDAYYYTLRTSLALFWCGVALLLIMALRFVPCQLSGWLDAPGRHSLLAYLLHLGILGGLVSLVGLQKNGAFIPLSSFLCILIVFVSHFMDWYRRKKVFIIGETRHP